MKLIVKDADVLKITDSTPGFKGKSESFGFLSSIGIQQIGES